MDEQVFWVWNGWGVLCMVVLALWQFLHSLVTSVARALYGYRHGLALVLAIPAFIAGFVLSGWIAGILNVLLGPLLGIAAFRLAFNPERL